MYGSARGLHGSFPGFGYGSVDDCEVVHAGGDELADDSAGGFVAGADLEDLAVALWRAAEAARALFLFRPVLQNPSLLSLGSSLKHFSTCGEWQAAQSRPFAPAVVMPADWEQSYGCPGLFGGRVGGTIRSCFRPYGLWRAGKRGNGGRCGARMWWFLLIGASTAFLLAMARFSSRLVVMFVGKKDRLLTWTACRVAGYERGR